MLQERTGKIVVPAPGPSALFELQSPRSDPHWLLTTLIGSSFHSTSWLRLDQRPGSERTRERQTGSNQHDETKTRHE